MMATGFRICAVLVVLSLLSACDLDEWDLEGTTISGTVNGESFSYSGGVAFESGSDYIIELVDHTDYDCTSTPSDNYLLIVISGVESEGTISASGNVSFNSTEYVEGSPIQTSHGATSGTITIDRLDMLRIEGALDALGPDSDVAGDFSVPIC